MGKDHKEVILTHLNTWRTIAQEEIEALRQGDLERLEKLAAQSAAIQARLDIILSGMDPSTIGREVLGVMNDIHELNSCLVGELGNGSLEISKEMGMLRKNRTSLNGYKQKKRSTPRFMNERT